jgi:hypothetical protein
MVRRISLGDIPNGYYQYLVAVPDTKKGYQQAAGLLVKLEVVICFLMY